MTEEKQKTEESATSRLYMVWHKGVEDHDAREVEASGPHDAARRFVTAWVASEPRDGRMRSLVVVAAKNCTGQTVIIEVEVEVGTCVHRGDGGQS